MKFKMIVSVVVLFAIAVQAPLIRSVLAQQTEVPGAVCVVAAECDEICLISLDITGTKCIALSCDPDTEIFRYCQTGGTSGTCCHKGGGAINIECDNCAGELCGDIVNDKCPNVWTCSCASDGELFYEHWTFTLTCTECT
jgi:hypothetical protein